MFDWTKEEEKQLKELQDKVFQLKQRKERAEEYQRRNNPAVGAYKPSKPSGFIYKL